MKKNIAIVALALLCSLNTKAQVMTDDFDTNQYGWTETTQRGGLAVIKDGVMRLEANTGSIYDKAKEKAVPAYVCATCYAPFDYNKPFTMTVDVLADKVGTWTNLGLLFDYEDDANFIVFKVHKDEAELLRFVRGTIVAVKREDLKLSKGKGIGLQIEVEYTLNELAFRVNGVKALSYRRRVAYGEYLLGTSGIGFYAEQGQKVSFDNLKIEQ